MPAELLNIVTKEGEHRFPVHVYLLLFALKSSFIYYAQILPIMDCVPILKT